MPDNAEIMLARDKFLFNALTNSCTIKFRLRGSGGYADEIIEIRLAYDEGARHWAISYNKPSWDENAGQLVTISNAENYFDSSLSNSLKDRHELCQIITINAALNDLLNGVFVGSYQCVQEPTNVDDGIWTLTKTITDDVTGTQKSVALTIKYTADSHVWSVEYPKESIVDVPNIAQYIELHKVANSIQLFDAADNNVAASQLNGVYGKSAEWSEGTNEIWELLDNGSPVAYLQYITGDSGLDYWRVFYFVQRSTGRFGNEAVPESDAGETRVSYNNIDYSTLLQETQIEVGGLPEKTPLEHLINSNYNGKYDRISEFAQGVQGIWKNNANGHRLKCSFDGVRNAYAWWVEDANGNIVQQQYDLSRLNPSVFPITETLINTGKFSGTYKTNMSYGGNAYTGQTYSAHIWQCVRTVEGGIDYVYTLSKRTQSNSTQDWTLVRTSGDEIVTYVLNSAQSQGLNMESDTITLQNIQIGGETISELVLQRTSSFQTGRWYRNDGYSLTYDGLNWSFFNELAVEQPYTPQEFNDSSLYNSYAYCASLAERPEVGNPENFTELEQAFVQSNPAIWKRSLPEFESNNEYCQVVCDDAGWHWVCCYDLPRTSNDIRQYFALPDFYTRNEIYINLTGQTMTDRLKAIINGTYTRQEATSDDEGNVQSAKWQKQGEYNGMRYISLLEYTSSSSMHWHFSAQWTDETGYTWTEQFPQIDNYFDVAQWENENTIKVAGCSDKNFNGTYTQVTPGVLWQKSVVIYDRSVDISLTYDSSIPSWTASYIEPIREDLVNAQKYLQLQNSSQVGIVGYVDDVYNGEYSLNGVTSEFYRRPGATGRNDTLTTLSMVEEKGQQKVKLQYAKADPILVGIKQFHNENLLEHYLRSESLVVQNCDTQVRNAIYAKTGEATWKTSLQENVQGQLTYDSIGSKWRLRNYYNAGQVDNVESHILFDEANVNSIELFGIGTYSNVDYSYLNGVYSKGLSGEFTGERSYEGSTINITIYGLSADNIKNKRWENIHLYSSPTSDASLTFASIGASGSNIRVNEFSSSVSSITLYNFEDDLSIYNGAYTLLNENLWKRDVQIPINGKNAQGIIILSKTSSGFTLSQPSIVDNIDGNLVDEIEVTPYDNFLRLEDFISNGSTILVSGFETLTSNFNGTYSSVLLENFPMDTTGVESVFSKQTINEYNETITVYLLFVPGIGWQLQYQYTENHTAMEISLGNEQAHLAPSALLSSFAISKIPSAIVNRGYNTDIYNGTWAKSDENNYWSKSVEVVNKAGNGVSATAMLTYNALAGNWSDKWSMNYVLEPISYTQFGAGQGVQKAFNDATSDPFVYTSLDTISVTNESIGDSSVLLDFQRQNGQLVWIATRTGTPNNAFVSKFGVGDAIVKFYESGNLVCQDENPLYLNGFWRAKFTKNVSTKTLTVKGSSVVGVNGDYTANGDGSWKNSQNFHIVNDGLNWKITSGSTTYYHAVLQGGLSNIYGVEMPPCTMQSVSTDEIVMIATNVVVGETPINAVEMRLFQRVENVDKQIASQNVNLIIKDTDFAGSLSTSALLYANRELTINEPSGITYCVAYNATPEQPELAYAAQAQCAIGASAQSGVSPIANFQAKLAIRCNYLLEVVRGSSSYAYNLYEGVKGKATELTIKDLLNGQTSQTLFGDDDDNIRITLNQNALWYDLKKLVKNGEQSEWQVVGRMMRCSFASGEVGVNASIGDCKFFYGDNWESRFNKALVGSNVEPSVYDIWSNGNDAGYQLHKGKLLATATSSAYGQGNAIQFAQGAFDFGKIAFTSNFGNAQVVQVAIYSEDGYSQCNKSSSYLIEQNHSTAQSDLRLKISGKSLMDLFGVNTYINGVYDVSAFELNGDAQQLPFERKFEIVYFENPLKIAQAQSSFYVNATDKKAHLRANLQYTLDNGLTYNDIGNLFKVDKIYAATNMGDVGNDPISGQAYPIKLDNSDAVSTNDFEFKSIGELADSGIEAAQAYYSFADGQYTYHFNMPYGYESSMTPERIVISNLKVRSGEMAAPIDLSGNYVFDHYDGDESDARNKVYSIMVDGAAGQYTIKKYSNSGSIYWGIYQGNTIMVVSYIAATTDEDSAYKAFLNGDSFAVNYSFSPYYYDSAMYGAASIAYYDATFESGQQRNYYLRLFDKYGNYTEIGLYHITLWTNAPESIYFKIIGSSGQEGYTGFYKKYGRFFPSEFVTLQFSAVSEIGMQYKITGDIMGNESARYVNYDGGLCNIVVKINPNANASLVGNPDANVAIAVEFKDEAGNTSSQQQQIAYISRLFRATHNNLVDTNEEENKITLVAISGNAQYKLTEKSTDESNFKRSWNEIWYPPTHGTPLNEDGSINETEALRIAKTTIDENMVNGPSSSELLMYDRLAVVNNVLQTDTDGRYLQNISAWNTTSKLYPTMLNSFSSDNEKTYWIVDNTGNLDFRLEFEVFDLNPSVTSTPKNLSSPYDGDVLVVYDASANGALNESTNADGTISYTLADSSKLTELFAVKGSFVREREAPFTIMSDSSEYSQENLEVTASGFITPNITRTSKVCLILYSDNSASASGFKLKAGPKHLAEIYNYDKCVGTGEFWVHNASSNRKVFSSPASLQLVYGYYASYATQYPELGAVAFDEPMDGTLLGTFASYLNLNTSNAGSLPASEYFPTRLISNADKNNKDNIVFWVNPTSNGEEWYANRVIKDYACYNDDFVDYSNPAFYVATNSVEPNKGNYYKFENPTAFPDGKLSSSYSISKDLGIITFGDVYHPPIGRIYGDYYYHTFYRLTSDGYGDLYFYGTGTLVPDSAAIDGQTDWAYVDLKIVNEGTNKLTSGMLQFLTRGYITSGTVVDTVLDYNRPWDVQKGTTAETVLRIGAVSEQSYETLVAQHPATRLNAKNARDSQTCAFGTIDAKGTIYLRVFWCIASALDSSGNATQWINITRGVKVCSAELTGKYYVQTSGN